MMKISKAKNERIKRKYFDYLRNAEGFSELTIKVVEKAIWKYEDFANDQDYRDFDDKKALTFKKYLSMTRNPQSEKSLSLTYQYHLLRHVHNFFMWLSGQPSYKSRIRPSYVRYLRLSKEDSRKATSPKLPKYPTMEYIKTLCESIKPINEIEARDRAMIAFTALTGMRDFAIVTLPIGCFDTESLTVYQDPNKGVHTKFSKNITTQVFKFDNELVNYILLWCRYLREKKLFTDTDPLFPSSRIEQVSDIENTFVVKGIDKTFWRDAGPMRKIFKNRMNDAGLEYFTPHKFRHFTISQAYRYVRTAEQLKAISQNVGHQNLGTTMFNYGNIDSPRVTQIISDMDFSGNEDVSVIDQQALESMKKLIATFEQKKFN